MGLLSNIRPVTYAGRVNCVTGYGAAARHQIHVLRSHGLRVNVVDTGSAGDPDPNRQSAFVQACRRSDTAASQSAASIVHMGPNMTAEWRRRLPKPHVLVSVWETTRLPSEWVPICNSFEQVWCATEWQARIYRESGVDPRRVKFVPFALDPAMYPVEGPTMPEIDALRREGYFVFGSMFQWTERKAPRALIGSFLAAFHRGERVALVLKAYEGDNPATSVQKHVDGIVNSYLPAGPRPKIVVLTRRITHDETLAFYRGLDCYVSAHRAEGFGLPIAEALLCGRPVIATNWSAPVEWAEGLYLPVDYTLEAPHSMGWQPFYTTDQRWAAPDQDSMSEWMRAVHEKRAGAPGRELVTARFDALCQDAGAYAQAAMESL